MTKSERLLEAVGMIDEKHVPEPEKVLKINSDDNIQEYHAKMTIVNPAEKKKRPLKWAALGTCAAAAAGAILLNNAFLTDRESIDRVFDRPEWETNTENLITISALPYWERGNSFSAADISLFQNSNPWTEDIYFDSMPVFLNKSYGSSVTGGTNCISNEKMRQMTEAAAEILGLTIETADFDYYTDDGSTPPVSFRAYCDGAKYGTEQVRIMVSSTGELDVRFDRKDYIDAIADEGQIHKCYTLPEGYYNTEGIYPDDLEQQEKTERYLTEQFNELIGYSDPQMMLYTQPYPRGADPARWLNIWFTDKGKDIREDVLNYNFASVNFYFNNKNPNQLFGINITDQLSTKCEYIGDYPLLTAEQARERLLSGRYSEYLSNDLLITESSIKRVEGVYNAGYDEKYLQPYYCFYIEVDSANGVNQYKKLYFPAIDPDGYQATDAVKTSDPVFPENTWDTKTAELPYLDVSDDLDFGNCFARDISEIGNQNNPWNESVELKNLPVFLNTARGTKTNEGYLSPSVLTKEEMIQTAERAADKLGLTIEKTVTDYAVNSDQVIDTLTAVCKGESYGVEQISIKVYSSGDRVRVHFGEAMELWDYYDNEKQCYQLPEGYELPCSVNIGLGTDITLEEDKKALTMLAEEFKELTGQENPALNVSNTPHYSGNTLTEYKIWNEDGDIVRNILNYNLAQVNFYSNGYNTGELGCIEMIDTLSGARYIGDYPIISVREAKEELLSQNAIVPLGSDKYGIPVINEELIEKVELVYGNGRGQKYLMPYYRFFVRSERESEGLEGYYEYSQYYVSAVWDMYLNDRETGIYKETSRYGYNTDNLPQITSRFTFHGSGSEGFNALYLRNEEQVAKPEIWQKNFELTEAPVFRNLAFNEDHPYSDQYYLDAAEMERMAKAAVNLLGGSIKESDFEYCVSDESLPEMLTVRADIPYAEVTVTVTVRSNGTVCINCFDTDELGVPMGGITLPSGIDITLPEGIREAAEFFKSNFSELIQYVEADISLEYAGNGQYEVYIHQHSEDVERNIVNYYLNNITLGLSETIDGQPISYVTYEVSDPDYERVISSITFNNRLCAAEYLGHYPLVTYDEAVELLTRGDYRSYVSKSKLKGGVISESDILYGELVYNNGTEDEYFQPYYRFYVELNETADWFEHGDDERVYGEFWVPAVVEEYRGSEKFLGADESFLRDIYGE